MGKLQDQVAIITGGGSGIGQATAKLFASEGATVVIADVDSVSATQTAQEISTNWGKAFPWQVDVSNKTSVQAMMQEVIERFGRIDILFNNAGIIMPNFIEDISDEDWQRVVGVNLTGVFLCIKHALPELRKTRGKIINMGSMNGLVGQVKNPAYSATKGGVIAMTRSLALDLAPAGIRVNAICPAGVVTPLLEKWFNLQEDPEQMRRNSDLSHMLGRTAEAQEIGQLALFLASSDSSFITGQAIPIEGGATLGYGSGPKPEWTNFT